LKSRYLVNIVEKKIIKEKVMKRVYLSIILTVASLFILSGCGNDSTIVQESVILGEFEDNTQDMNELIDEIFNSEDNTEIKQSRSKTIIKSSKELETINARLKKVKGVDEEGNDISWISKVANNLDKYGKDMIYVSKGTYKKFYLVTRWMDNNHNKLEGFIYIKILKVYGKTEPYRDLVLPCILNFEDGYYDGYDKAYIFRLNKLPTVDDTKEVAEINPNGWSVLMHPGGYDADIKKWYISPGSPFHSGVDLYSDDWNWGDYPKADYGKEFYSGMGGEVIFTGLRYNLNGTKRYTRPEDAWFGYQVIIYNKKYKVAIRYAHLSSINVSENSKVVAGDLLGKIGNSGKTTNGGTFYPHLHVTLYKNIDANALSNLKKGKWPHGNGNYMAGGANYRAMFKWKKFPMPSKYIGTKILRSADPIEKWKNKKYSDTITTYQLKNGNASHHLSPAELIYWACKENNVNPVMILGRLQLEQSIIEKKFVGQVFESKLARVAGYNMKNSGDTKSAYGFYAQLLGVTYQFSLYESYYRYNFDEALEQYTYDPNNPSDPAHKNNIYSTYKKYASVMNGIAGTNFSLTPGSYGYYHDFGSISSKDIQKFLERYNNRLKDKSLFKEEPDSLNIIGDLKYKKEPELY
jgi:murein DD-endopeptidase MepM/ murein hydrolase activator NlpD